MTSHISAAARNMLLTCRAKSAHDEVLMLFGMYSLPEFEAEHGKLQWTDEDAEQAVEIFAATVLDPVSGVNGGHALRAGIDVELAARAFEAFEFTLNEQQRATLGQSLYMDLPTEVQDHIEAIELNAIAHVSADAARRITENDHSGPDPFVTLAVMPFAPVLRSPRKRRDLTLTA